ncbi:protease-4 [Arcicella rosea]|uniref:signal peptide peptidase SppA n=1 Tax=Arcicella rosea TaxID=502909 RepID=UPI00345CED73
MLQFLKYVLATIVGLIVFSIVSFILVIGIAAAVGASQEDIILKDNSVLKLDLNHAIEENVSDEENPFKDLGGPFMDNNESIGMVQIREALKRAAADSHIKGIYLQAHYPQAGYAQLEEIRNALLAFKKSGKFIYSYGESFTEKGYYVSSVSDKIYLNPAGGMDFNGISAEVSFYKGALDKLDIKPVVFRVGEYKSAVEPYLRENMSDANKAQYSSLLNSINDHIFGQIAASRDITVAELKKVADELIAYKPKGALAAKLVTDVGYYDEFEADFKKKLKKESEDKIDFVNLSKFLKAESAIPFNDTQNKIAVVVGEGAIIGSKADKGNIGSDDWVAELRKARDDKKVKAIVLRIDSPGGSSLASDVMWREVELARKVKPVIASMADYAASGGYYMAMAADTIVAEPTTITGSIGIFAQFFNFENFLKNKLGITNDRVNTNAHSDFPTVTREMTDFEKDWFQRSVDAGYETFTSKAAKGRRMSIEKLKTLAGGHVWSGIEAKSNGLVDVLGGLEDAIKIAAKKAKLKEGDYKAKFYPQPKSFFEEIFDKKEDAVQAKIMKAQFGELAPYVKQIQDLKAREGLMTLMPEVIEFK